MRWRQRETELGGGWGASGAARVKGGGDEKAECEGLRCMTLEGYASHPKYTGTGEAVGEFCVAECATPVFNPST